jgi:hypothetical protein
MVRAMVENMRMMKVLMDGEVTSAYFTRTPSRGSTLTRAHYVYNTLPFMGSS